MSARKLPAAITGDALKRERVTFYEWICWACEESTTQLSSPAQVDAFIKEHAGCNRLPAVPDSHYDIIELRRLMDYE
jgi:hypothetical protein